MPHTSVYEDGTTDTMEHGARVHPTHPATACQPVRSSAPDDIDALLDTPPAALIRSQDGLPQPSAPLPTSPPLDLAEAVDVQTANEHAQCNEQQPASSRPNQDAAHQGDTSGAVQASYREKHTAGGQRVAPLDRIRTLWGEQIVVFYDIQHLSNRLLTALHTVAADWPWHAFVPAINQILLARHRNVRKAAVQGRFPVTVVDLSNLPPASARAPSRPPSPDRQATPAGLWYDRYGLLVQAGPGPNEPPEPPAGTTTRDVDASDPQEPVTILLSLAANCRMENVPM